MNFFEDDDDIDPNAESDLDINHRPYCRKHFCLMFAQHTGRRVTHYRCRVPGCDERSKKLRAPFVLPDQAQPCPKCSKGEKVVHCVVREFRFFNVVLECPSKRCNFTLKMPRPDIELQIQKYKRRKSFYDRRWMGQDR